MVVSDASLGPSSFIVLGLIAQRGGGTSYDLKRWADESVGYFWTFPRSQLYAEPQRLVSLGLLSEQQEAEGRRKRTFQITAAGQQKLQEWLRSPAGLPELRDLGLLKLFFIAGDDQQTLQVLATEQLALHQARLSEYEQIEAAFACDPEAQAPLRALRMGFLYERASIAFWNEVLEFTPASRSAAASALD